MSKTYSKAYITVNGKETATLDIYRTGNTFNIYEFDMNVFSSPSYIKAAEFVNNYIDGYAKLVECMRASGMTVTVSRGCFERT